MKKFVAIVMVLVLTISLFPSNVLVLAAGTDGNSVSNIHTHNQDDWFCIYTPGEAELPAGAKYAIEETSADGYKTTITGATDPASDKKATVTLDENGATVEYKNDRTVYVPTNATMEYGWLVPFILLDVMGIIFLEVNRSRRRRKGGDPA